MIRKHWHCTIVIRTKILYAGLFWSANELMVPISEVGFNTRKSVFKGLQTTKVQISLRIQAVWSAPLLFAFWKESSKLPKIKIWIFLLVSVAEETRLSLALSKTPKTGFVASLTIYVVQSFFKVIQWGNMSIFLSELSSTGNLYVACASSEGSGETVWMCRLYARPPDNIVDWKMIFLISQPKHTLWVLKRTVSMRRFFWAPKTHV